MQCGSPEQNRMEVHSRQPSDWRRHLIGIGTNVTMYIGLQVWNHTKNTIVYNIAINCQCFPSLSVFSWQQTCAVQLETGSFKLLLGLLMNTSKMSHTSYLHNTWDYYRHCNEICQRMLSPMSIKRRHKRRLGRENEGEDDDVMTRLMAMLMKLVVERDTEGRVGTINMKEIIRHWAKPPHF